MRSLILTLFIVFGGSFWSSAQIVETCADSQMPANVVNGVPNPDFASVITFDPTWTTNAEGYTPSNLGAGFTTVYYSFTVDMMQFYTINIQGEPGSAAIGNPISVSLDSDCLNLMTSAEVFADVVPPNLSPEDLGCVNLAPGTTYTLALAMDPTQIGDVSITVTDAVGAGNLTCATASPMVVGSNTGNNSCSSGLVWYSYTVVNGGSVSLTPSMSATGDDISTPVITQTSIDGCTSFTGDVAWTCLPPGTVINFEAGDDTAPIEQGNFNIDIVDDVTGLPNEICADVAAMPVAAPSCVTTTLTDMTNNTTVNACQELLNFDVCNVFNAEATVWFAFTTDADAQTVDIEVTNGTISGATFVLIDGTAGCPSMATTVAGCQLTGSLLDQVIMPSTTYYIAVATSAGGTDGTFTLTVTPQNPPANDICDPDAIDISATAAAGVDGTTTCASNDPLDFCGAFIEDHVVYYTYTVDAGILTNRTITITTGNAVVPISGTNATSLGYGIFDDCLGTAATMPSGAALLPLTGGTGVLCAPLAGPITYECVEPGTSFTIAVASADGMEGDFNITITESATGAATNDICDLGTNPDILTTATGTNFCADGEYNFCGMPNTTDHQVWYQYTNMTAANVDLQVTFGGTGTATSATDLSMLVLSGACGTNVVFPGTPATGFCNILDAVTTISCIEAGETIRILVGSAEDPTVMGPEGDFTITAMEISNSPANDECTGAVDITPPTTCDWILVSGLTPLVSAENACPEDFMTFPVGCDFTIESTVWYSITIPNDGETYTLEIQNIANDAFLAIYESTGADCDTYGTPVAINSDCETGAGPHGIAYDDLVNGATYLIAVGDPTAASGFDFEIKLNLIPDNDECADAVVLMIGPATNGTTSCATQPMAGEYNSAECLDTDETNTVFYSYEVPASDKGFNVTITAAATEGLMGDINLVVFEDDPVGSCATGTGATAVDEVCTASTTLNEFDCVGPGTYIIRVSTSEANAGDFQITITPIALVQPNDFCDSPDVLSLNPGLECMWMEVTANSVGACPEDVFLDPVPMCGLSVGAVVWYEITAPLTATFLDLRLISGNGANPIMAVFPGNPVDCDNQTFLAGSNCYDGTFTDLVANGDAWIPVTGGDTYLIAVGVTDPLGSMIDFGIKWITPPPNDDCLVSGPGTGAEALMANVATDGTTACATQPMGGEYNSGACLDIDETNTVFYTFEVMPGFKGFHVMIEAAATNGLMGDINLVVFEDDPAGSCATGTGATAIDEVCTTSLTLNEEFECVGEGTYVIRVATSIANEGDFQITVTPIAIEQPNDNCDMADDVEFAAALECEWMVIDANTTGACPEDMNLDDFDCGLDEFPVTWYEATAPANAEFLDLQINFGGVTPFISVFEVGPDCDDLANVTGSNCYSGTFDDLDDIAQDLIDVTPGTTYLIAIGSDADAGTIINFGIKWITPPDNDDCVDAEIFMPVNPGPDPGTFTQTLIMETTQCATEMFPLTGTACDLNNTNTVWYTYTVEMDVKEITIDVTNYMPTNGGITDFSIYVADACPDAGGNMTLVNQADGTPATYCGGEGTELITLSCIDEGTTITFSITSSTDNEATFDVTLNTAIPNCTYTNDECGDAIAFSATPIIMDDPLDCVPIPGCNDLACTEYDFSGPCPGIDILNSVFYTFTTDDLLDVNGMPVDAAFVNIEVTNGEAGELDAPGAILLEGDCNSPAVIGACAGTGSLGEFNSGPLGMPGQILPNTTYTVVVYNSNDMQNGGTFDLCITVTSGCVNDDICDAFTLDPGVTIDNPASSNDCTADFTVTTGCDGTLSNATLWYQVEVPEGVSSIEIILNNEVAPDGVEGEVSIAVGPLVDCNALDVTDVLYEDCTGFATNIHEILCAIEYGTYWIQIGSDDEMEAGDFTITYNFNMAPDPPNDICSQAEELVVTDICEFVTFPGTLKDACPELFDLGACEYSVNQAVWFTITIPFGPPTVTDMDIEIEGLTNPMIGVFEFDCMNAGDPANNNGIINSTMNPDGTVDCSQMALTEGIIVTEGTTYHILVSTSTMEDIIFDINIKLNAPPINDDPCITSDNPPFDLTGGGSHSGTTCCARGPKDANPDGSPADFENVDCSAATEDAGVWYMYTPDEGDDGYDVILENINMGGNVTVETYWGAPDAGCNGFAETIESSCADQSVHITIPNCPMPGEVLFVKVTTDDADDQCGEFIMTVTPASCPNAAADDCEDAQILMTMTPPSCEAGENILSVDGCLDYACPETAFAECEVQNGPTVWYQIDIDSEDATQLITQVEADGFIPVWNIYQGTSCGDMLAIVDPEPAPDPSFPCSSSDGTIGNNFQTAIADDPGTGEIFTYWIAITATGDIEDGSFTLNYGSSLGCISCSGENAFDCDNGDFSAVIDGVEVDYDPFDPDSPNPFCPGTEVSVCLEFNYNTTGTGNDWLHGIIPSFGPGWDIDIIDFPSLDLGGGDWEWADADGACAPYLNGYNLPNVCTYMEDGILKFCNTACDPNCPCDGPMLDGDPLPSGWFWNSNGGSPTCAGECTPSDDWGVPGGTNVDVSICIDLIIKSYDPAMTNLTYDEWCEQNGDLQINIQTTSDAISGCWEDPSPCIIDPSFAGPEWEINCDTPPNVSGDPQELCDNGMVDIQVTTDDGSQTTIIVNPIPNANVNGATMHTFPDGTGIIDDVLDNTTGNVQIQIYEAFSSDPTKPCEGNVTLIEVTIYPELMAEFDDTDVCEGDCITISPTVLGGVGAPYTYLWSPTNETTASITVCPTVTTTYEVTVTDALGCMDVADTEVIVRPPVVISFEEDPIDACKDGNFDPFQPEYVATLVFESGSPQYFVNWLPGAGLVGQSTSVNSFNDSWIIDEESTSGLLSPYQLCAEVTDQFGCMADTCMTVNITGEITLLPEILGLECGVNEAQIRVTGFDDGGGDINDFNLFGGCPAIDLLETGFSNIGVVVFDINETYLNNYSQFTIEGISSSGCVASICVDLVIPQGTPIEISGDENICEGDMATITITNAAAAGYTDYMWTPDVGTTASVTVSPTVTTIYFVETMDGVGCVSDTSFTVMVNPDPIIGLSGATQFCAGGSATITATGGDTYNWTGPGTASGDSYTATMAGSVNLEVVSAFGCTSDSTITFTEENQIDVIIGGPNLCDGNSDTLFVTGSFTSYEWTFNAAIVGTDSILIITEAGTYDISVIDATGCPGQGSIVIDNFTTPQAMVTDSLTVCNEDSGVGPVTVDFDAQVTGDLGTWTQLTNVVTFDPADVSSVDFTGVSPGCYGYVYATMSATAPCMNTSDTLYVCVEACPCPRPDTREIPDLCNDDTYDLNEAKVTLEPGTWNTIDGPATQVLTGLIVGDEFNAVGILPGTYTVEFTLDAPGNSPPCEVSSTQTIEVFEALEITVMAGTMCNIDGQAFPSTLDLYTLISVDASDGGVWTQIGTPMVTISAGSEIAASDLSDFPVDLVFSYTSGDPVGPCGPVTVTVDVEIRDCECIYVNVLPDTLCSDGGIIDLTLLLENPGDLAGNWSVNPGSITGTNMFDTDVLSGSYTITYTLTESAGPGCDVIYSNEIIVRKKPVIDFADGPLPCSEDTGNGPTAIDLYEWLESTSSSGTWTQTGGATVTFVDDGSTAIVDFAAFEPLDVFEFTFTTNAANDPCTDISAPLTIEVQDCECPDINPFTIDDACNDDDIIDLNPLSVGSDPGTFTFFNSGGADLSTNIDIDNMLDVTGLPDGTYTVVYTLNTTPSGTCVGSVSAPFEIQDYNTIEGAMMADVCSDPNGSDPSALNFLQLVVGASFEGWEDVDNTMVDLSDNLALQSVSFAGIAAGDYTFTYTIDNVETCQDYVHTLIVSVTEICDCESINPEEPADECNTDGPIDLTQYDDTSLPGVWSSTELTINGGNSLEIAGVAAGTYTLTYTIDNPLPDCPATEDVDILIGEPANAGNQDTPFRLCEETISVIILADLLDNEDDGGTWTETSSTLSSGFDDAAGTFTTDAEVAGTYTFEYSISENDPCPPVSAIATVIIDPNPVADAGNPLPLNCVNLSEILGGASTTGVDIEYSWVNTITGEDLGSTETIEVTDEGTYELTVLNTTTGCTHSNSAVVTKSDEIPSMVVTPRPITCFGFDDGGATISEQMGGDGNYTYELNGGAATADPNDFSTLPAGDYEIVIIDGLGCRSDPELFTITEPDALVVEAGPNIVTGDLGESFTLSIEPFDTTTVTSIVWSNSETTDTICNGLDCTSITVTPTEVTTNYYVEVTNANGCTAFDEVQIQTFIVVGVVFPNIITPNGDNINDDFYIKSKDVETVISMKIFDRWGEKVFDLGNFPPRDPDFAWDGKFKGKKVVPGVFVFTVEVLFVNGERKTISGDVTVTDSE